MIQVQMTDQELNRALAELMGYTADKHRPGRVLNGNMSVMPKSYCTDSAASLEVQTAAIAKDPEEYIRNLSIVQHGSDPKVREMVGVNLKGAAMMCDAKPRERAEAAYITLQGAK